MSSGVKITLIIVGAIVLLGLTCIGGCFGFALWAGTRPAPEGITATLDMPTTITEGDTFDMVLTVTNDLSEERKLIDVDFWEPLFDGVIINNVDPSYEQADNIMFMNTYTFNTTIPANSELVITFNATAHTAGYYQANMDLSVDSMFSTLSTQQAISISAP